MQLRTTTAIGVALVLGATVWLTRSRAGGDKETAMQSDQLEIYSVEQGKLITTNRVVRTDEEWKQLLTPQQYQVLRHHATERAGTGKCDLPKKDGVYICAGCGTDLFKIDHKFESGTGWPSFWEPVHPNNVGTTVDNSLFMTRTEVHCARCGGHLGHVFDDGPPPTGTRYCINAAAMTVRPLPK